MDVHGGLWEIEQIFEGKRGDAALEGDVEGVRGRDRRFVHVRHGTAGVLTSGVLVAGVLVPGGLGKAGQGGDDEEGCEEAHRGSVVLGGCEGIGGDGRSFSE